ncbi:MAG: type II toxin-antitoxin system HicA family toxin [Gammaproteobacteria bacterium]|nr:type II toxin-antitoxin system HicA family toxin [Gammaproteobacteria bacterium]
MAKIDNILDRMRNNPRDWQIESLESIALKFGMKVRKSGGSHVVFMHKDSPIAVTVPAHRPIKPAYIRQFLSLIDDIGA